eukprot:CAMPEP_0170199142 /NCGR_PEP_ID=MMETSP0040_2-20121228/69175_1 /TAXON_ID=641309 /ORGANISM="Lotharella oceanica, Strain CCMP622" /LENGTH=53 /DNA_ID=CAMNT_0010449229 /DNA_START=361 /DNA_END=519 /DNA_ORIENTATION=-
MSSGLKEKLTNLEEIKDKMEKAKDPKEVCNEILARLQQAKDPLVKSDEVDNEW